MRPELTKKARNLARAVFEWPPQSNGTQIVGAQNLGARVGMPARHRHGHRFQIGRLDDESSRDWTEEIVRTTEGDVDLVAFQRAQRCRQTATHTQLGEKMGSLGSKTAHDS
ncbi:hypothetical protein JOD67_007011 [Tenggerimyces flavus]|nr:hypothetical protein [Tenggerimyces flavus]